MSIWLIRHANGMVLVCITIDEYGFNARCQPCVLQDFGSWILFWLEYLFEVSYSFKHWQQPFQLNVEINYFILWKSSDGFKHHIGPIFVKYVSWKIGPIPNQNVKILKCQNLFVGFGFNLSITKTLFDMFQLSRD